MLTFVALGFVVPALHGANFVVTNLADSGAGTLRQAMLDANAGGAYGGGICAVTGLVSVVNCTIVGNVTTSAAPFVGPMGGGVTNVSAVFQMLNSIVTDNSSSQQPDLAGSFSSGGYNMIGNTNGASGLVASDLTTTSALLSTLQDNRGPTLTHALLPGSPAIDAGTGVGAPLVDQRGFPRPSGNGVDIGACEFRSALQSISTTNGKVQIQFLLEPNQSYQIQASTNFPSWQTISMIPKDPSGRFLYEDPADLRRRFYRTLLSP